MSYTVQQAIEDTQRHLHGTQRQHLNRLTAGISDSATSITLDWDLGDLRERSVIGIGTELMYVISTSGQTATVARGFNSDASAHTAGDFVEVNPRFPQAMIIRALQDEIRSWPVGLYKVETVEFSVANGIYAWDLAGFTGSLSHVLEVTVSPPSGDTTLTWQPVQRWRLTRAADTVFGSGYALTVPASAWGARDFRVTVATTFDPDPFLVTTDLLADVGLSASMLDIPPLGAASRLLVGKEVIRTSLDSQGQTRRAEEVPPGYAVQTSMAIQRMRDKRISEEAMRLRKDWPIRGF